MISGRQCTLITGASAGLGVDFARGYAARGHDLILVARRADRLDALARDLETQHGIHVMTVPVDLTEPGAVPDIMQRVKAAGRTITTLINNAGFGLRGEFAELDGASQAQMIDLNCRVLVELSHAVLPDMIAAGQGGILNVASTAAFLPGPWMAVYYATKAFVLSFSEALHHEVQAKGVMVSALCPGPTQTEFFAVAQMADTMLARYTMGSAKQVVLDGMRALDRNKAVKISGTLNLIAALSIRVTPRALARRIAGSLQRKRGVTGG